MNGIAEKIPAVHIVDIDIVGIEPRYRPWVNHGKPVSTILKTPRPTGEVGAVHVKGVAAAKAGPKAVIGNASMAPTGRRSIGRLLMVGPLLLLRGLSRLLLMVGPLLLLRGLSRLLLLLGPLLLLRRLSLLLLLLWLFFLITVFLCARRHDTSRKKDQNCCTEKVC
jgi:hypothetical protein